MSVNEGNCETLRDLHATGTCRTLDAPFGSDRNLFMCKYIAQRFGVRSNKPAGRDVSSLLLASIQCSAGFLSNKPAGRVAKSLSEIHKTSSAGKPCNTSEGNVLILLPLSRSCLVWDRSANASFDMAVMPLPLRSRVSEKSSLRLGDRVPTFMGQEPLRTSVPSAVLSKTHPVGPPQVHGSPPGGSNAASLYEHSAAAAKCNPHSATSRSSIADGPRTNGTAVYIRTQDSD